MEFRSVGAVERSSKSLARSLEPWIDFKGKVPESSLPDHYAWGDVFIFPTIEDGFPAVLAQAQAAGLPILATPNCSAPDFVIPDKTGWIVPIRDPEALEERLRWCDANRKPLATIVREAADSFKARSYDEVAADFEKLAHDSIADLRPRKIADN
jgi:glycosyltransferase involved in cell wall biosynthesis